MNTVLPQSVDEAISAPRPQPRSAFPALVAVVSLWSLTAWALQSVIWPKAAPAAPQTAGISLQGLNAANAIELTDEVVTALAADQFSSLLLKIQLAQKVAQRLQRAAPSSPVSR